MWINTRALLLLMTEALLEDSSNAEQMGRYNDFGNKAGLLRAITQQINDNMMTKVRRAPPSESGLSAILAFIGVYLGRRDPEWTNTRSLLNLMTHALLEGSEHSDLMVDFNASMFKYIEDNIRIGIERGEIDRSISPPIAAEFVIGTLRGMMLQRLVKGGDIQAATLRKHLQSLVERALRAA
jgi:AcrR family transcriptional regulator